MLLEVLEVSQDVPPVRPRLQQVRPQRGQCSLGCRGAGLALPRPAGHQTLPPPESSQLAVDFLPLSLPVRQLSGLPAVLGLLQLLGLTRVPLPFLLLILSLIFPLLVSPLLLLVPGPALRTFVHRDLGQLLLEEVHVWLEGLVGDQTVRDGGRLSVSHSPSSVEPRGDLPWLGTGQADGDDEDEREEGEGDHDGIPENLSCVGTHLDWTGQLPAPLYEEKVTVEHPVIVGLVVS